MDEERERGTEEGVTGIINKSTPVELQTNLLTKPKPFAKIKES